jgi:hypothetical protein
MSSSIRLGLSDVPLNADETLGTGSQAPFLSYSEPCQKSKYPTEALKFFSWSYVNGSQTAEELDCPIGFVVPAIRNKWAKKWDDRENPALII